MVDYDLCPICNGKGDVNTFNISNGQVVDVRKIECRNCKGTGWVPIVYKDDHFSEDSECNSR